METFTFWRCVRGAWVDAWRYICRRPVLVMAFFLPSWVAPYIEVILRPAPHLPFRLLVWVPLVVFEVCRVGVTAALSADALRFLLLAERPAVDESLFGRFYWRYFGVMLGLLLGMLAIAAVGVVFAIGLVFVIALNHVRAPLSIPILVGGAAIGSGFIGLFLVTRLSLLTTHVAIGGGVRIVEAWRDTRGRFWSLWLTQAIATLPMVVVARFTIHAPLFAARPSGLVALLEAIDNVAAACVGAACAAWLYRRYAQRLRSPQQPSAGAPDLSC